MGAYSSSWKAVNSQIGHQYPQQSSTADSDENTGDYHWPNAVTGAPLVLEFQKIFLRPAVLPESDITFTAQELSTWAARIW